MSEENKSGGDGELLPEKAEQETQQPVKEFKLTITKNIKDGSICVQGPGNGQFYDKWVCCGLLDDARDFIKMHNAKASQNKIIKANPSMMQQARNIFKRR